MADQQEGDPQEKADTYETYLQVISQNNSTLTVPKTQYFDCIPYKNGVNMIYISI